MLFAIKPHEEFCRTHAILGRLNIYSSIKSLTDLDLNSNLCYLEHEFAALPIVLTLFRYDVK